MNLAPRFSRCFFPAVALAFSLSAHGEAAATNLSAAPATPAIRPALAPAVLPGRGLAQHPFVYTGEWDFRKKEQTVYIVRDGQVAWSYAIPTQDTNGVMQELGDATLLSNGNLLFCRKTGASEVNPDKQIVWDFPAAPGAEIHSVQPLGLDRVLLVQNGNPAKLQVINIKTGQTEKELTLPVPHPEKAHLQFRRVRQTAAGTYLAAHLDANKVVEYDATGKAIWSYSAPGAWSATRLKNGNTLISTYHHTVIEVNPQGQVVWQFTQEDVPEYRCFIFQEVSRLANGNTVICNWCPVDLKDPKQWPGSVQVLEVTPEKKVVWALRQWDQPDLCPASSLQLLDEPGVPENPGEPPR